MSHLTQGPYAQPEKNRVFTSSQPSPRKASFWSSPAACKGHEGSQALSRNARDLRVVVSGSRVYIDVDFESWAASV